MFSRFLRLLCPCAIALLLAAPLAASAADPTPTPAPVAVKTRPDLSQYKSAEDLWQKYQSSYSPPYAEDWLATQWYLCDEIVRRFPDSPLVWQARSSEACVLMRSAEQGLPGINAEQCLSLYQALANDPHIPSVAREGIRTSILALLSHACPVETLSKEMRSYLHDYPDMAKNHLHLGITNSATDRLGKSDPELTRAIADITPDLERKAYGDTLANLEAARKTAREAVRVRPFDLKFTALDSTEVDAAKLRGKVVLLDFWATWCGPCMAEMPEIATVYQKYHAHGLEIIGVSLDEGTEAEIKQELPKFAAKHGMVWPQYCDGKGWKGELVKQYGFDSIPQLFLVNKQGAFVANDDIRSHLDEAVAKLLAQ